MNLCPTCGWHSCVAETMEVECPLCKTEFTAFSHDDQGHQAWELLHSERTPTDIWFENWRDNVVPKYGCMCVEFLNSYVEIHPPTFDPDQWFEWTVGLHNAVNAKLGKDLMSLEDARSEWQV